MLLRTEAGKGLDFICFEIFEPNVCSHCKDVLNEEVKFDFEGQGQCPPPPPPPQKKKKINRDLNQGILHLCSQFGDPTFNGGRVINGQAQNWVIWNFKSNLTLEVRVDHFTK